MEEPPARTVNTQQPFENEALLRRIRTYLNDDYLQAKDRDIQENYRRFQLQTADLNGDGADEFLIYLRSPYFCGSGGCNVLLLDQELNLLTEWKATWPPFWVSATSNNGWRVLLVQHAGRIVELRWERGGYPSNPSLLEDAGRQDVDDRWPVLFRREDTNLSTHTF